MKIQQIFENRPGAEKPSMTALRKSRNLLNSMYGFIRDLTSGKYDVIHGKRITIEAVKKTLEGYKHDMERVIKAIEAVKEGTATDEQINMILEFDESKLGKDIKLYEGK